MPLWLRRLWERMVAIYGHAWTSVHDVSPNDDDGKLTLSGDTWAKALIGVTPQQLADGLQACIAEGAEFPPAVGRFRGMCLGIPSVERVKLELHSHDDDRSPFTRMVWGLIDGYAYRHASGRDAEKILQRAYDMAREDRMRGAPLPPPPAALIEQEEPRKPVPATKDQVAGHMADIGQILGGGQ